MGRITDSALTNQAEQRIIAIKTETTLKNMETKIEDGR